MAEIMSNKSDDEHLRVFAATLFLLRCIKYLTDNTVQILGVLQNDILYILI